MGCARPLCQRRQAVVSWRLAKAYSPWQRVRRRVSLWERSYEHPDGYLELDIDEKAGVDPGDDDSSGC